MQIKIKTDDMELEFQDDNSTIYVDTKTRIIEIIQEIRKKPTISAYEALGVPNAGRIISSFHNPTDEERAEAQRIADAWDRSNMPTDTMAPTFTQKDK